MKVAVFLAGLASASAFAPSANNARTSVALDAEQSRREIFGAIGAAAAFIPAAANAAAGESPRFSVFGLVGDGTAYSEGAAYGSDQSVPVYSPYSVYSAAGADSAYKPGGDEEVAKKKAVLSETKNRLSLIPAYIEKKEWFNVKDELTRYMYETRGATKYFATTPQLKEKAQTFFEAMELTYTSATLKKGETCAKANTAALAALDEFVASI